MNYEFVLFFNMEIVKMQLIRKYLLVKKTYVFGFFLNIGLRNISNHRLPVCLHFITILSKN